MAVAAGKAARTAANKAWEIGQLQSAFHKLETYWDYDISTACFLATPRYLEKAELEQLANFAGFPRGVKVTMKKALEGIDMKALHDLFVRQKTRPEGANSAHGGS